MGTKNKPNSAAADLSEPQVTSELVWLWNRGGPIDRNTVRCGNLMLSINVQSSEADVPGRAGQNENMMVRVRPGLAKVNSGYMDRVKLDVGRQKAYASRTNSPLTGIAKWLDDGELVVLEDGVDGLNKRDAKKAIEGSSDLSLILEIANGSGSYVSIARDHLERITDGGSAILGHFSSHDRN